MTIRISIAPPEKFRERKLPYSPSDIANYLWRSTRLEATSENWNVRSLRGVRKERPLHVAAGESVGCCPQLLGKFPEF